MTKQEQIEEINKIIRSKFCSPVAYKMTISYGNIDKYSEYSPVYTSDIAEALYDAGYRKLPEIAVVLTGEEYSDYRILNDKYEHAIEKLLKLQADNEKLYRNLGKFKESVRKETAKEIISFIESKDKIGDKYSIYTKLLQELKEKYGEVEE